MSKITAETAPAHVAAHFNGFAANLGIQSPLTNKFEPFPSLAASDFVVIEENDHQLVLSLDPLTGPNIRATVDTASGLIQYDPVVLVVE